MKIFLVLLLCAAVLSAVLCGCVEKAEQTDGTLASDVTDASQESGTQDASVPDAGLKLIEQHMRLGRIYDKKNVKFYDAPWKDIYIENLQKTLSCYQAGLYYWQEAKLWAEKANVKRFQFLTLTDIQNWEDERERIGNGKLNYEKILNREIARVQKNISDFESMTDKTY